MATVNIVLQLGHSVVTNRQALIIAIVNPPENSVLITEENDALPPVTHFSEDTQPKDGEHGQTWILDLTRDANLSLLFVCCLMLHINDGMKKWCETIIVIHMIQDID